MKSKIYFWILFAGTLIFITALYYFIPFPQTVGQYNVNADMDLNILVTARASMSASQLNGYILSASIRILSAYLAFVALTFGHYHMIRKQLSIAA
jgi:hypothetical protein